MAHRDEISAGLKRLLDSHGHLAIPWRVVRYGRRLVDIEQGTPPEFCNVYHDGATRQRKTVEAFLERVDGHLPAEWFWTTLMKCTPVGSADADVRRALAFCARDALDLFVGLVVSGLPFPQEQEQAVLACMENVLRPVFPKSRDLLSEDLADPAIVSKGVFGELDRCCHDRGLSSGYVLGTTLHFVNYSYRDVLTALRTGADSSC